MRLSIVGGTYLERCQFPRSLELFGSGVRAAAALSGRNGKIELITLVGEKYFDELVQLSRSFGFEVNAEKTSDVYEFVYRHPLAPPVWYEPEDAEPRYLAVTGENILAYGMMEGRPVITGKNVVYDPQAHDRPDEFQANGSSANRLAVIANQNEAYHLTNERDPRAAALTIIKKQGADAVVIKCGTRGAVAATSSSFDEIPACITTKTFKVGSGDVFSAAFAYEWLIAGESALQSAKVASRSTAYYCQTRNMRVTRPLPGTFNPPLVKMGKPKRIYLSGPFFSIQQLWVVEEARRCLEEQGVDVFSPYHDIGPGRPKYVASKDLEQLDKCDALFAILDGFDVGTVFEIGYAVSKKKPVTAICTSSAPESLTMISGTNCSVFEDFASAIYWAAWH